MKILAVDDSPFVRELLPKLLSKTEFSPIRVADGAESTLVLLSLDEEKFDCFILDIEMPGMDGIELCSRIRNLSRYSQTPIIMLTARTDADTIERAFAAGANDYILKNSDAKEFINRIRVAKRLTQREHAMTLSCSAQDTKLSTKNSRKGEHLFDLSEDLLIGGNTSIISSFSLGNYLSQLPREELDDTKVFCVQIEEIKSLYRETSTPDFARLIETVADGIAISVNSTRLLMAYSGHGSYICVARGITLPSSTNLKFDIERHLLLTASETRVDALELAQVNVGTPVVPYAKRAQRVRRSFDRAMARAQTCRNMETNWNGTTNLERYGVL